MSRRLPIRWRVVGVTCGGLVAMFVVFMLTVRYALFEVYQSRAESQTEVSAGLLATNIYRTLERSAAVNRMAANYPGLLLAPHDRQRATLQSMQRMFSIAEVVSLIDLKGNEIAKSNGTLRFMGERPWLRDFVRTRQGDISPVYFSATTANLVVAMTHGIYDGHDQPLAMLLAVIRVRDLQTMVRQFSVGMGCKSYLFDDQGSALAHPGDAQESHIFSYLNMTQTYIRRSKEGYVLRRDENNLDVAEDDFVVWKNMYNLLHKVRGETGRTVYLDENGERYICAYQPVSLPGTTKQWTIMFMMPYAQVYAAVDRIMLSTGLIGSLFMVIIAALLYLSLHRVTQSVDNMIEVSQEVSQGDCSRKVPVLGNDEMGDLERNFNSMVDGLDELHRKQAAEKERIRRLAYRDTLTGLPNRKYFAEFAAGVLRTAQTDNGHGVLLFIDLDHFKAVNDTYGHGVGDELLVQVGHRLLALAGNHDYLCRLGGDEFLIILPDFDVDAAKDKAEHILAAMRDEFYIGQRVINISASVGAVCYDAGCDDLEALIRRADEAMYSTKYGGRNGLNFYAPSDGEKRTLEFGVWS